MSLTDSSLRIALLLLPGVIAYLGFTQLRGPTRKRTWEDILFILVLAVTCYLLYGVSLAVVKWNIGALDSMQWIRAFEDPSISPRAVYWETFVASILGAGLALGLAYSSRHRLLNRLGQRLGATSRFGGEDIWDHYHNLSADQKHGGWVVVRDHKLNLFYHGYITAWSDSDHERELIITQVDVFSEDSNEKINERQAIYLSRGRYDLTIEVPLAHAEQGDQDEQQTER